MRVLHLFKSVLPDVMGGVAAGDIDSSPGVLALPDAHHLDVPESDSLDFPEMAGQWAPILGHWRDF